MPYVSPLDPISNIDNQFEVLSAEPQTLMNKLGNEYHELRATVYDIERNEIHFITVDPSMIFIDDVDFDEMDFLINRSADNIRADNWSDEYFYEPEECYDLCDLDVYWDESRYASIIGLLLQLYFIDKNNVPVDVDPFDAFKTHKASAAARQALADQRKFQAEQHERLQ